MEKNTYLHMRFFWVLAVFIVIDIFIGSVMSFMTSSDHAWNTFRTAAQTLEIEERWDPPTEFEEGNRYTKEVSVRNTGTTPCYVRVFAEMERPEMEEAIEVDYDLATGSGPGWLKFSDGYYYYTEKIDAGDSTPPLFSKLTAKKDVTDFRMIVYAETVQCEGHTSYADAWDID